MKKLLTGLACALLLMGGTACDHIDNDVTPGTIVRINLGTYGLWNVYGVKGVGDYTYFNRAKRLPSNFAYNANTFTGYGGVLLMMCLDASTASYSPQAFDAACPVENRADITVSIDPQNFDAVCPTCKSRYNVLTGSGGPTQGKAVERKVGLTIYKVRQTTNGGYIITSY